jgi:UDP-glucose 4-epimerase
LANVYGPRQDSKGEAGVIAIFCDKMLTGKKAIINGNGKQTRDFVYVEDVVDAAILSIKTSKTGIYNIGTSKETSINKIFKELRILINPKIKEIYGPAKKGEQKRSCLDYGKAKKELGWQPKFTLEKGLKETVNWFRKNKF